MSQRMTSITLPDLWQIRTREGFGDRLTFASEALGVDPALVASLGTELGPALEAAQAQGLVLLAGFLEAIDPEPMDPGPIDLESLGLDDEFDIDLFADDVGPTAIGASLALLEQPRTDGGAEGLRVALEEATGRWIAEIEEVDLPCGPAVVTREIQAVHPPTASRAIDVMVVTYYLLPVEAPDLILVALFRTPSLGFARELDEQFGAIAATIEVVDGDAGAR